MESAYAVAAFDTKPGAYSCSAATPSEPVSSAMNSVTSELTISRMASPLPRRKDRFGRPYTMLKADSSTLKSESEVQSNATPPTMPSVAALS